MCSEEAGQGRASRREVEVTRITLNMDCTGVLQIHTHSSALEVKWPVGPRDSLPSLCGACCCPSGTTSQSSGWPVSVLAPPHRGGLVCNQEPYIGSLQSRETVGMTYRSMHEELHFLCVNSLPKPPPFGLPSLLLLPLFSLLVSKSENTLPALQRAYFPRGLHKRHWEEASDSAELGFAWIQFSQPCKGLSLLGRWS